MKYPTLILIWFFLTKLQTLNSINPYARFCDNMDLSTFCIIGNHFRHVVYDEDRRKVKYSDFKNMEKIVATFFPPMYDVDNVTGYILPWPWIQDNKDDVDYTIVADRLLIFNTPVKGARAPPPGSPSGTPPTSRKTGGMVQGFRFNLYSVNDLCGLDKLYSPIYKLHSDTGPPQQLAEPPEITSALSVLPFKDYRLPYRCDTPTPAPVSATNPCTTCPRIICVTTTTTTGTPARPNNGQNWRAQEAYEQFMENPFDVKVTEISVNDQHLMNHLHFQIGFKNGIKETFARGPGMSTFPPYRPEPGLGKADANLPITYAFIIVHDENGSPIGDFDTGIPCGECKGKCVAGANLCHQARPEDSIPCMIVSKEVVTHPGQLMIHMPEGVATIHATWRFSQSSNPKSFIKEIHIKTLLVLEGRENEPMVLVRDNRVDYRHSNLDRVHDFYSCGHPNFEEIYKLHSPKHCYRHSPKYGIFGWNAKYPILFPTVETLGGYDFFPKRFLKEEVVDCHIPLNESRFKSQDYPVYRYGIGNPLPTTTGIDPLEMGLPKWKIDLDEGPSLIMGSKSEIYQGLSLETPKYYTGMVDEKNLLLIGDRELDPQKYLPKERVVPSELSGQTIAQLSQLKRIEDMQEAERCRCPRFGTIPPPKAEHVPQIGHLEGRRDHSIQMTIAWIALVPFAIFVSRYYKETYSKVFFLQEFWWYTIHVLTFILAAVFMAGGIYAIEIKRSEPFNLADKHQVIHAALGAFSIFMFTMQLCFGALRLKRPKFRRIQILLHWFCGLLNYLLALGTMLVAAFIKSGCMNCITLILIGVWVVIQITMYIVMEVHMHISDKSLHLDPPRSYLPPPVMRVFHKNAPGAKFRIVMLVVFGTFSTLFYAVMHFTIEAGGPHFRSCFKYDEALEKIQLQYIKLVAE